MDFKRFTINAPHKNSVGVLEREDSNSIPFYRFIEVEKELQTLDNHLHQSQQQTETEFPQENEQERLEWGIVIVIREKRRGNLSGNLISLGSKKPDNRETSMTNVTCTVKL